MTLTPAYGRDYKSKKAVVEAFNGDATFIVSDMSSPWDGKPVNRSGLVGSVAEVNIRYGSLRKVCVVRVGS